MQALTRAQMRERIRRGRFAITTPFLMRVQGAEEGDAPPNEPWPDNLTLNDAIEEAVSICNNEVGFHGTSERISYSVTAQTATGPYYIQTDRIHFTPRGTVNSIRGAWWINSGDTDSVYLEPVTYDVLIRDHPGWGELEVGTPKYILMDAGKVGLLPGPDTAGTLELLLGMSMTSPVGDIDTLGYFPADHYGLVMDIAAKEIADSLPGDYEMDLRSKRLASRIERKMRNLVDWFQSQTEEHEPVIAFESYRRVRR